MKNAMLPLTCLLPLLGCAAPPQVLFDGEMPEDQVAAIRDAGKLDSIDDIDVTAGTLHVPPSIHIFLRLLIHEARKFSVVEQVNSSL